MASGLPPTLHTEPNNLHTRGQVISTLSPTSHSHVHLLHLCDHIHLCFTLLSILKPSLSHPFTLPQAILSTSILLTVYHLHHKFSTPAITFPINATIRLLQIHKTKLHSTFFSLVLSHLSSLWWRCDLHTPSCSEGPLAHHQSIPQ